MQLSASGSDTSVDASGVSGRLRMPPSRNAAHVWVGHPDQFGPPPLLELLWSWLAPDEQRRYQAFHSAHDREAFLVSHGGLRYLIGRYTGTPPEALRFRCGVHGRPELVQPATGCRLRFNISHTRGLVAWVFSVDRACGVDVEQIRCDAAVHDLVPVVCSREESTALALLGEDDRRTAFYLTWSLKEALLKACGTGLTADITSITVRNTGPERYSAATLPRSLRVQGNWALHGTLWGKAHVLAVACDHDHETPVRLHVRPLPAEIIGRHNFGAVRRARSTCESRSRREPHAKLR